MSGELATPHLSSLTLVAAKAPARQSGAIFEVELGQGSGRRRVISTLRRHESARRSQMRRPARQLVHEGDGRSAPSERTQHCRDHLVGPQILVSVTRRTTTIVPDGMELLLCGPCMQRRRSSGKYESEVAYWITAT